MLYTVAGLYSPHQANISMQSFSHLICGDELEEDIYIICPQSLHLSQNPEAHLSLTWKDMANVHLLIH